MNSKFKMESLVSFILEHYPFFGFVKVIGMITYRIFSFNASFCILYMTNVKI